MAGTWKLPELIPSFSSDLLICLLITKVYQRVAPKTKEAIARDNQLCHKNAWFKRLGTTICTFSLYIFSDFQD